MVRLILWGYCIGINCWGEQLIPVSKIKHTLNHELPNVELVSNGQILIGQGNQTWYTPTNAEYLLTINLKQHLVRPGDPIAARSAQADLRPQIAEFSGTSESQDRLGHRAKEKLLDRVGGRSHLCFCVIC